MGKDFKRTDRIAEQIQRELAVIALREIKDPRVGMVNFTFVEVSRDLAYAKIYLTILGQDDPVKINETIAVLNRAAGFLRTLLAQRIQLRIMPHLKFIYDETQVKAHHLQSLIDQAVSQINENNDDNNPEPDSDPK